ncbi:MAG: hypothetical protein SFV20_14585 [Sphingopyxis sp.]|nr:hypothetical protein [Sphingopyxis sp.]
MLKKIGRLFVIKTRFEACLIIYALAVGAMARGMLYLDKFPGTGGVLLLLACTGSVFLAGAKIFDCIRLEQMLALANASGALDPQRERS